MSDLSAQTSTTSVADSIDKIDCELINLWNQQFSNQLHQSDKPVYVPMPYEKPVDDALLFVGLNPSFSIAGWKSVLRDSEHAQVDTGSVYKWKGSTQRALDVELMSKLEGLARQKYAFFGPHRCLAKSLDMEWCHLDLFAYRETSQKEARDLLFEPPNSTATLTNFGKAQIALFKRTLALSRPKAVIVINALASMVFRAHLSPTFDASNGYYRLGEDQVPVFFSGMLTGGRALDRFSRDRLFWHVAKALRKCWKPTDN